MDGAHLTLRFIGAASPETAPALGEAVLRAAAGIEPFESSLADAGAFPSRGAPRVLWVGVGGALDALTGLRQSVEDALSAAGLPYEERTFAPHVTLARVNAKLSREEAQALRGSVTALDVRTSRSWWRRSGSTTATCSPRARSTPAWRRLGWELVPSPEGEGAAAAL